MSFTLRCHGNEFDDLLTLFHFSSVRHSSFSMRCLNKKIMSDQLVIVPFNNLQIRTKLSASFCCTANIVSNQLTLKCTARSAWMHCKEKKQKNYFSVKCTTRRSQLLKFIFRKKYVITFWWKMEITDLLGLILEMSMHNFVEIFLE